MKWPERDDGPPTPVHSTGAYPVFQQGARETAEKLDAIDAEHARRLADEMRAFELLFASWSPTHRPTEAQRTKLITDFMSLYRKCQEMLTR